jgi:hypothetical protein
MRLGVMTHTAAPAWISARTGRVPRSGVAQQITAINSRSAMALWFERFIVSLFLNLPADVTWISLRPSPVLFRRTLAGTTTYMVNRHFARIHPSNLPGIGMLSIWKGIKDAPIFTASARRNRDRAVAFRRV